MIEHQKEHDHSQGSGRGHIKREIGGRGTCLGQASVKKAKIDAVAVAVEGVGEGALMKGGPGVGI